MSSNNKSWIFFQEEDIPNLIQNVVHNKESSQDDFIEALPLILQKMKPEKVRTELIPFIKDWINFGDRFNAQIFTSMLPLFMPPHFPPQTFYDLLTQINEIIRQSSIFVEKQIINMCECIKKSFDKEAIHSVFLPNLGQLFQPLDSDSHGVAILAEASFISSADEHWRNTILERLKTFHNSDSSYIRMCVLNSFPYLIDAPVDIEHLIETLLIPSFSDNDFKIRCLATKIATIVGQPFFSNSQWLHLYLQTSDDESWNVRFSLALNMKLAIPNVENPSLFASHLIKLTKDPVDQIRALSLSVLTDTIEFFPEESLNEIPVIFNNSMHSQIEEIRTTGIHLWASLLKHHPNAPFQANLLNTLDLINFLPIESLIYSMLNLVVPLVPQQNLNLKTIENGINTLIGSVSPYWKQKGISIIIHYSKIPFLHDLARIMAESILHLFDSTCFSLRCSIGQMIVQLSFDISWDWFNEKALNLITDGIENGSCYVRMSLTRTIIELLLHKPPHHLKEQLKKLLDTVINDPVDEVRNHATSCKSLLKHIKKMSGHKGHHHSMHVGKQIEHHETKD